MDIGAPILCSETGFSDIVPKAHASAYAGVIKGHALDDLGQPNICLYHRAMLPTHTIQLPTAAFFGGGGGCHIRDIFERLQKEAVYPRLPKVSQLDELWIDSITMLKNDAGGCWVVGSPCHDSPTMAPTWYDMMVSDRVHLWLSYLTRRLDNDIYRSRPRLDLDQR